jgi:DNA-binding transcriptional MocR family regulator
VVELTGIAEEDVVASAAERGISVRGLGSYAVGRTGGTPSTALVLGYGRLAEPAIADAVAELAAAALPHQQRRATTSPGGELGHALRAQR